MSESTAHQLFEIEALKVLKKLTRQEESKEASKSQSQGTSSAITQDSFNDIENVVFQGGGILGLAYLGVLKKFQEHDFLDKIKRIGGTSAGSMVAMYLGLNMSYKDMEILMSRNYAELLDTDVKLKVKTHPKFPIYSHWYQERSIKDIVLSSTHFLLEIEALVQAHRDHEADKRMHQLINDIMDYSASFLGRWLRDIIDLGSNFASRKFVDMAVKWFLGLITPKSTDPHKFASSFGGITNQNNEKNKSTAKHIMQCTTGFSYSESTHKVPPIESSVVPTLRGTQLNYSIAALLHFMLVEQKDSENNSVKLGFFSANKIRQELIMDPIVARLKDADDSNRHLDHDCTFAELAGCLDKNTGKPLSRPFYIIAFNTSTLRSEIFSVKHTPNVVVADAVRASLSIPVFFRPVTVREKIDGVLKPRKIHYEELNDQGVMERKDHEVYYMDGGLFDNYPLWLFDDLKYCVPDFLADEMNLRERIPIQNPKTLGFKLIGQTRMEIYKKPYYDNAKTQVKRISALNYSEDFCYMSSTLVQAEIGEHEESDFINKEYSSRTGYVDNHDISAIAFGLTQHQKDQLIRSGEDAVEDYFRRVRNNFAGEGQRYS